MALADAFAVGVGPAAVATCELIAPERLLGLAELVRVLVVGAVWTRDRLPARLPVARAGGLRACQACQVRAIGPGREERMPSITAVVRLREDEPGPVGSPDRFLSTEVPRRGEELDEAAPVGVDAVVTLAVQELVVEHDRSAVRRPVREVDGYVVAADSREVAAVRLDRPEAGAAFIEVAPVERNLRSVRRPRWLAGHVWK